MLAALSAMAQAQTPPETAAGLPAEILPRLPTPQTGQAPTMRVTELDPHKRSFQIVFSKGDEAIQGLAEFAARNNITLAHFTAFGALQSASIAWFNAETRAYKTIRVNEPMEVTSFTGSIIRNAAGVPVVHAHGSVALYRNGMVHAGHIIDARISVTMQVYLDDSVPLAKPAN